MADSCGVPRAAPGWLVVCDFDGTIARVDVTDGILSRFAPPEWETVEAEWKAGRIGSRECMRQQVQMLQAPRAALDAYLDTVEIDRDFAGFVADCERRYLPVVIISDGIDYAIRRILRRNGLGRMTLASNRLATTETESGTAYRLEFPHVNAACRAGSGTCKCAVSAAHSDGARRLLIGDGSSDFCLAGSADLVFAKDGLLRHCREQRLAHLACPDFATARQLLDELSLATPAREAASRSRAYPYQPVTPAAILEI